MTYENLLGTLVQSLGQKLPEWISALAASVSMCGVLLVWVQIRMAKNVAQLQFEDALEKEYRELIAKIPTKALLDSDLDEDEYRSTFDEFFCYFDLSNRQASLWKQGRIGGVTWENWKTGIRLNMALPAFERAWAEIKLRTAEHADEFFSELRSLEKSDFEGNAKNWPN